MKETGILFQPAMVRALLRDVATKEQTRRALRVQPHDDCGEIMCGPYHPTVIRRGEEEPGPETFGAYSADGSWALPCPYGRPGDRLWVRETFWAFGHWVTEFDPELDRDAWHFIDLTIETDRIYQFDDPTPTVRRRRKLAGATPEWWKRPAIFMPRVASRITLEITEVRVQKLQSLSEADAIAEGIERLPDTGAGTGPNQFTVRVGSALLSAPTAVETYAHLWAAINGAGSWEANHWVWCVSFRRV